MLSTLVWETEPTNPRKAQMLFCHVNKENSFRVKYLVSGKGIQEFYGSIEQDDSHQVTGVFVDQDLGETIAHGLFHQHENGNFTLDLFITTESVGLEIDFEPEHYKTILTC